MVIKTNRSGGARYPSGYTDVQDHGLVGNCRTAALISISGTVAQVRASSVPHRSRELTDTSSYAFLTLIPPGESAPGTEGRMGEGGHGDDHVGELTSRRQRICQDPRQGPVRIASSLVDTGAKGGLNAAEVTSASRARTPLKASSNTLPLRTFSRPSSSPTLVWVRSWVSEKPRSIGGDLTLRPDFMPLSSVTKSPFLPWLVRRVEVIRGSLTFVVVSR